MTQIERALGGYAFVTVVVAIVVAAVAAIMSNRAGASGLRSLIWGALAGSVTCLLGVTLAPSIGTPSGVELVPFTNIGAASGRTQLLCNLVLTAPSGLLCALATRTIRTSISVGVILCVAIEAAQLALPIGRVASVEDALITSLGWIGGTWCAAMIRCFASDPA